MLACKSGNLEINQMLFADERLKPNTTVNYFLFFLFFVIFNSTCCRIILV